MNSERTITGRLSAREGNDSSVPLPSPPSIPDHELLRRIGGGSYGEVWLARNAIGSLHAVKIIYRNAFSNDRPFEREFTGIQKAMPVSRAIPGLVQILHVGRNDAAGYFYYVMELADDANAERGVRNAESALTCPADTLAHPMGEGLGEEFPYSYIPRTLQSEATTRGALPAEECIVLGLALTEALGQLHAQGLVHRDIKPSNIIFVRGAPKLADIGLMASASEAQSFVGTAGFIPPEGPGTPQADLYSLGKVLYEISTGKDRQEFPQLPVELIGGNASAERGMRNHPVPRRSLFRTPRFALRIYLLCSNSTPSSSKPASPTHVRVIDPLPKCTPTLNCCAKASRSKPSG
jgi:serine/threonine protein kinase